MASSRSFEQLTGQALRELRTLRDEVRLKIHLASMDRRDAWERLRPEVDRVANRLEIAFEEAAALGDRFGDEAELQFHLGWMEARDRWHSLEPHVDRVVSHLQTLGEEVADAADQAVEETKLQSTLAKMEARDFIREHRATLAQALDERWTEIRDEATKVLGDLKSDFQRMARAVAKHSDEET